MENLRAALGAAVALTLLAAPAPAADSAPEEAMVAKDSSFNRRGDDGGELHYTDRRARAGSRAGAARSGESAQSLNDASFAANCSVPAPALDGRTKIFHKKQLPTASARQIGTSRRSDEDGVYEIKLRRHVDCAVRWSTRCSAIQHLRLVSGNSMGGMHTGLGRALPQLWTCGRWLAATRWRSAQLMIRRMMLEEHIRQRFPI